MNRPQLTQEIIDANYPELEIETESTEPDGVYVPSSQGETEFEFLTR